MTDGEAADVLRNLELETAMTPDELAAMERAIEALGADVEQIRVLDELSRCQCERVGES